MTLVHKIQRPEMTPRAAAWLAAVCGAMLTAAVAQAQDFPLTVEHKFGTTIISAAPERVATVDYAGADNILALRFQPLTVRAWFGPYDNALWPWAQAVATEDPVVIGAQLDFEAIAATDPDVILALRSGITAAEFARLSAIAPTIAVPPDKGDYDLLWHEQAALAGHALGRADLAAALIDGITTQVTDFAEAHPDWRGKSFAMMTYWDGSVGVYTATDSSVAFITALGLVPHPRVTELSTPGQFYVPISEEILPEFDADIIFWFADPDNADVLGLAARSVMRAPAEGREVFLALDKVANGALSHGSLLSIPAALSSLEPMIDAALDGDPAAPVPLD